MLCGCYIQPKSNRRKDTRPTDRDKLGATPQQREGQGYKREMALGQEKLGAPHQLVSCRPGQGCGGGPWQARSQGFTDHVHGESLKPRELCWAGRSPCLNSIIKTKGNIAHWANPCWGKRQNLVGEMTQWAGLTSLTPPVCSPLCWVTWVDRDERKTPTSGILEFVRSVGLAISFHSG